MRILLRCSLITAFLWLAACSSPSALPRGEAQALADGERLYKQSCGGCHGARARGDGPVAPLLTVRVPDLTLIASRRDGKFPENEIFRIIDGQADLAAHGPRHMPIWGFEFFGDDPDDAAAHSQATFKIDHLVRYLRSIQRSE